MAAVAFSAKLPEPSDVVDETWFSDPVLCEQKKLWYMLSKTLAEDASVKFSRENGLELVAINPGYVIGPILQPTLNMTSEGFVRLIETGQGVFADGIYRLVDVRDVAMAHILAFENPKANGRYCVVGKVIHSSEIMKIVAELYPSLGHSKGYNIPLVANIHFAPSVALRVAECFDKIRVNPGNFADRRAQFEQLEYTDDDYQQELEHIEWEDVVLSTFRPSNRS